MEMMKQLRRKLSALILWCTFVALYLGGVFLLIIGLVFASRTWWTLIQQHAGWWAISTKTAEAFILAVGLVLVLVIPFFQRRAVDRSSPWRAERRSEMKSRVPAAD